MKAERIMVMNQDRLSTWDEIRRATSSNPDRVVEGLYSGNYCEVGSDFGGVIRYPAEEFEFFSYLSEIDESSVN